MSLVDEADEYNTIASQYSAIDLLPAGSLYQQQVEHALGPDSTGKAVLDLGGGSGLHARKAVDRNAAIVDVVDISSGMIEMGQAIGRSLGRATDRIRWFLGDVSKPLDELALKEDGYDVVMVNWTFDHAENMEQLEGMWANVSRYCKPGGKLINIRISNVYAKTGGRYGLGLRDQEEIPGGCRYVYVIHTQPEISAHATTMNASWEFAKYKLLAEKYGFTDIARVPDSELGVVKDDPEFWKPHLEDPSFICVTARKL
jgi:ubiquinone/menaquinone biosynthesis C-methylase UbiE